MPIFGMFVTCPRVNQIGQRETHQSIRWRLTTGGGYSVPGKPNDPNDPCDYPALRSVTWSSCRSSTWEEQHLADDQGEADVEADSGSLVTKQIITGVEHAISERCTTPVMICLNH